jgi:hypothetical protein
MNERIRELMTQATRIEDPDGLFLREVFDREKFAKLIIQECCDIITPYNIKDGVMFDISTNLPPIYVIKKHFGVE